MYKKQNICTTTVLYWQYYWDIFIQWFSGVFERHFSQISWLSMYQYWKEYKSVNGREQVRIRNRSIFKTFFAAQWYITSGFQFNMSTCGLPSNVRVSRVRFCILLFLCYGQFLWFVFSACGGLRTGSKLPVLTAYFQLLRASPLEDCLNVLTGSSTQAGNVVQLIGSSEVWPTARHWPDIRSV